MNSTQKALIREVFLRNGFAIKDGRDDLDDYVYEAAFELLELATPAMQREPASGVVPSRDDLIKCLLATRGQSEGTTADAILSMLSAAPAVQGEPVGKIKTVGGYPDESEHTIEWLCKYKELKDGDLLYTAPQPAPSSWLPENWREKAADLIKAAHFDGQKSATGRDPSPFRWVNSESYKAAQALLADPAPEAVQVEPVGFCEDTAISLAERTFSSEVDEQLAEDVIQYARRLHGLYAATQPVERQPAPDADGLEMVDVAQDGQYPPCDFCGATPDHHPWHGSGMFKGVDSPHIHACNGCRHLLPAPDVAALVEALESALGSFDDWCEGQDPSDIADAMDTFPWVMQARAALTAHRKGGV